MQPETLSTRTLNRALLTRQHLLERSCRNPIAVMEAMGGIQMQYAPSGYIGLWSRVPDFERPTLTRLLEARRAVQGTMLRATIHTVSAADYWPMMAGIREAVRKWSARVRASEIGSTDIDAVVAAIREELRGGPLRIAELTARIEARGHPRRAIAWAKPFVELVRVPPSGTWERRRADLYALADQWLPPRGDVGEEEGIEHLIRRHLGAFGPASLRDIAHWMGLNVGGVGPVAERMVLRPYRDEDGRPLVDLPELAVTEPDRPAPVRFLPVWDATLLVHARRTQVLPEAHRSRVFNTRTPQSLNTFLVDGQVAGSWRFEHGEIRLEPFRRLSTEEAAALEEEAHRLATFHADEPRDTEEDA